MVIKLTSSSSLLTAMLSLALSNVGISWPGAPRPRSSPISPSSSWNILWCYSCIQFQENINHLFLGQKLCRGINLRSCRDLKLILEGTHVSFDWVSETKVCLTPSVDCLYLDYDTVHVSLYSSFPGLTRQTGPSSAWVTHAQGERVTSLIKETLHWWESLMISTHISSISTHQRTET